MEEGESGNDVENSVKWTHGPAAKHETIGAASFRMIIKFCNMIRLHPSVNHVSTTSTCLLPHHFSRLWHTALFSSLFHAAKLGRIPAPNPRRLPWVSDAWRPPVAPIDDHTHLLHRDDFDRFDDSCSSIPPIHPQIAHYRPYFPPDKFLVDALRVQTFSLDRLMARATHIVFAQSHIILFVDISC